MPAEVTLNRVSSAIISGKRNDTKSRRYDDNSRLGPTFQQSPFGGRLEMTSFNEDGHVPRRPSSLSSNALGHSLSHEMRPSAAVRPKPAGLLHSGGAAAFDQMKDSKELAKMMGLVSMRDAEARDFSPLSESTTVSQHSSPPSKKSGTHPLLLMMFNSVLTATEDSRLPESPLNHSTGLSGATIPKDSSSPPAPHVSVPLPRVQLPKVKSATNTILPTSTPPLSQHQTLAPFPPKREEICRNFLRGRCNWGPRCHRVHPANESSSDCAHIRTSDAILTSTSSSTSKPTTASKMICLDWLQGYCSLGRSCPQIHIAAENLTQHASPESSKSAIDSSLLYSPSTTDATLGIETRTVTDHESSVARHIGFTHVCLSSRLSSMITDDSTPACGATSQNHQYP